MPMSTAADRRLRKPFGVNGGLSQKGGRQEVFLGFAGERHLRNLGGGFYQTSRMSFTDLKFAVENDEKESQCL
jgi:hypothetical protein